MYLRMQLRFFLFVIFFFLSLVSSKHSFLFVLVSRLSHAYWNGSQMELLLLQDFALSHSCWAYICVYIYMWIFNIVNVGLIKRKVESCDAIYLSSSISFFLVFFSTPFASFFWWLIVLSFRFSVKNQEKP